MLTDNKKLVEVGLIKGRHELPVTEYIWNEVPDVLDFDAMDKHICSWLSNHVGITSHIGVALNSAGYDDTLVFAGKRSLIVYVTGLTACTASLIKICAINGVELTLKHYDRDTGTYVEQYVF